MTRDYYRVALSRVRKRHQVSAAKGVDLKKDLPVRTVRSNEPPAPTSEVSEPIEATQVASSRFTFDPFKPVG